MTKTMTCYLMGGLGNQLFQLFATISYAIKTQSKFIFTNAKTLGGNGNTMRYTYWETFLKRLKPFLREQMDYSRMEMIKESSFEYNDLYASLSSCIDRNTNHTILLFGYFQSYQYFQDNKDAILRMIGLDSIKTELLKKMNVDETYWKTTVSLHFRIGDYKQLQDFHPIMKIEYYLKSLQKICEKTNQDTWNILYFCEEKDVDDVNRAILILKQQYTNCHFMKVNANLQDWEQMVLMSCCHHNIIANSTFSWWGAYLNTWEDKIVCYPSIWFGKKLNHDTKDLCPEEWNKIDINVYSPG
jgi:hypothetical protein